MNWVKTFEDTAGGLLDAVEKARGDLKSIVIQANRDVGSAEASVLVMNEENTHLQFLVSLNEKLDAGDVMIARGEAFSGYVFESGQVIAKVNPDSVGAAQVEHKAGVRTEYLLAVPVMIDGRVVAVGTFVNRADHVPDQAFIKDELDVAQYYAGLYAVALKAHRQAVMTYRIACADLRLLAEQLGIDVTAIDKLDHQHRFARGFEDSIFTIGSQLSASERNTWKRFGNFLLSEHREDDEDEDEIFD